MNKIITCLLAGAGFAHLAAADLLLTYDFKNTPTASQVDPGYLDPAVTAPDITEVGDPDGGGSSPDLTNFSGYSLNIKRNSLDSDLTNFSDYLTFAISAVNAGELVDLDNMELRFNSFSDHFSLAVYVDAGSGFNQVATLGGADNSALANSTQQLGMGSVAAANVLDFRIELAHAAPGGAANTTLQFAQIDLNGSVIPEPATMGLFLLALAGLNGIRRIMV